MKAINDKEWSELLNKRTRYYLKINPECKPLVEKLLNIGGDFVVIWMYEPDLEKILEKGQLFDHKIILREMQPTKCHFNVASLWADEDVTIVTGWALSKDGLWRQHSWALKGNTIIETTEKREKYFGIALDQKESEEFHYNNW